MDSQGLGFAVDDCTGAGLFGFLAAAEVGVDADAHVNYFRVSKQLRLLSEGANDAH